MKFTIKLLVVGYIFWVANSANAQFLRDLLSNNEDPGLSSARDDLPGPHSDAEELSFDEVICKDKDNFPKEIDSFLYASYAECISNLDRIQNASYIDLTYRIRWDNKRLDLYRSNVRNIYICDNKKMTHYKHTEKTDPDWWMIVRNSLYFVECEADVSVERLN